MSAGGAICDGGEAWLERRIGFCPTEQRRRRMVLRLQPWYGAEWMCTGCGDRWSEEGRGYRPFERGWRRRAIEYHLRLWRQARSPDREARRAWLAATL